MDGLGRILTIVLITFLPIFSSIPAYSQQLIQITSPANNSLATEGQTVTITVSASPSVQRVAVIGQDPLPAVQPTSTANQFSLAIPTTIPPGPYNLTAIGVDASGDVESAPVTIDVERQYGPTNISASPPMLSLSSIGDQFPIQVSGTFSDGTTLDITRSTRVVFSSNNVKIATVSRSGVITAVGPGQTGIMVQAGGGTLYTYAAVYVIVATQPPSGQSGNRRGVPNVTRAATN